VNYYYFVLLLLITFEHTYHAIVLLWWFYWANWHNSVIYATIKTISLNMFTFGDLRLCIMEQDENLDGFVLLPNSFEIPYLGNIDLSLHVVIELSPMFRNVYTYLVRVSSHIVGEIVEYDSARVTKAYICNTMIPHTKNCTNHKDFIRWISNKTYIHGCQFHYK
jgi:hypothetical protein